MRRNDWPLLWIGHCDSPRATGSQRRERDTSCLPSQTLRGAVCSRDSRCTVVQSTLNHFLAEEMKHRPDFDTFRKLAQSGKLVPIFRQLVSDTLTPVSAYCKIQSGNASFLFESVVGGEKIGRYSFLG